MVHIETGQMCAGKIINRQRMKGDYRLIQNEISALKALRNSPYIVSIIDHFDSQNNTYLVTEMCNGGELFEYIHQRGCLREAEAAFIIKQIVCGVSYMHARGYIHRDLKTENCLVRTDKFGAPESVAIADFGMTYYVANNNNIVTNVCGTPGYMAPEMIQRSGHGKPVDMWAIGSMTYFALSGVNPFQRGPRRGNRDETYAAVNGIYDFLPAHRWHNVSSTARDFIASLLVVDPAQRMTAKQALQHPWLQGCSTPEPRLSSSMMNSYCKIDTHSQLSMTNDATMLDSIATQNSQEFTKQQKRQYSSQATNVGSQAQHHGNSREMKGIEEESAEQREIANSSEETAADFNSAPSELSKLPTMQSEPAGSRYQLRSQKQAKNQLIGYSNNGGVNWLYTPAASATDLSSMHTHPRECR
ncbi:Calcium/calmodulin-dependent protein kinase type I [Coemansia sp. RSA 2523]|nr:Calcium/calmodulin-dependent protein kinase type I [Coemansia sp. RSA 1752]KAJ1810758.1 Calcium/calmodulin-dependent protein kinase type I [Coemansia sp. RSA 2523]KAJ2257867.1 Calcium/calmodulin-dependent protein kinase type I [Coemansia sp. RSA 454]KAJ2430356.1 Calcium/calmodulin-dependent protein kinase type I [Coemansia sp. RSA 2524]